eukprot:TRINITY_DN32383_c0_g1_i1.p1 TRINITY_DN32383_c0_g1~~TRINITY_DN32383_c0_g1_i1.p1  ORF type:complete len:916 (-),score=164.49 TRINITY_DN32383_c0_g1_i1:82-2829(-)
MSGNDEEQNIRVCVRVRPFNEREEGECCCVAMPTDTQVTVTKNEGAGDIHNFQFDRAYWSHDPLHAGFASQELVMLEVGQGLLDSTFEGFNSCMFAYGQTGAGKSFSVLGSDSPPENQGLLPRILRAIFERVSAQMDEKCKFQCQVSYMEIYNENIRDLLIPLDKHKSQKLEVKHHPQFGNYVPGLTVNAVTSYADVKKILDFGIKTRSVASTNMNATSSRSHCIFTFRLFRQQDDNGRKSEQRASVNVVDLAGSERASKTGASGDRLKEGAKINQSLSNLAIVINKLAKVSDRGNGFVPFRNSKLTQVLQESLSGNSKTVMIAALSPALSNVDETLSTLRFAQTCKDIKTTAVKNQKTEAVVADLTAEITRLKEQLEQGTDASLLSQVQDAEALKQQLVQDYEVQLSEAKALEQQRTKAMEDMGLDISEISGMARVDPNVPQLINLSEDSSLSGCLVYFLLPDKDMKVGSDSACDIVLSGLGIHSYMCSLRNSDNKSVMLSILDAAGMQAQVPGSQFTPGRILVAGRAVVGGSREVKHTQRIILGHAFCFRVSIPLAAAAENGKNNGRRQRNKLQTAVEEALFEALPDSQDGFEDYREIIGHVQDRVGPDEAEEFVEALGMLLPLIEEGNLMTSEVRPQDQLRFSVEVCSNIKSFSDVAPTLLVRLYKEVAPDCQVIVDTVDVEGYKERLTDMREAYHSYKLNPGAMDFSKPGSDPWASCSYRDVQQLVLSMQSEFEEEHAKNHTLRISDCFKRGIRKTVQADLETMQAELARAKKEAAENHCECERLRAALAAATEESKHLQVQSSGNMPASACSGSLTAQGVQDCKDSTTESPKVHPQSILADLAAAQSHLRNMRVQLGRAQELDQRQKETWEAIASRLTGPSSGEGATARGRAIPRKSSSPRKSLFADVMF